MNPVAHSFSNSISRLEALNQIARKLQDRIYSYPDSGDIEKLTKLVDTQMTVLQNIHYLTNPLPEPTPPSPTLPWTADDAEELMKETHTPHRGSDVEAWIRSRRDEYAGEPEWNTLDDALDDYRLYADTGRPLTSPVRDPNQPDIDDGN